MTSCAQPIGRLLLLVLLVAACSPAGQGTADAPVATPTGDPELTAAVTTTFATYRSGVERGDADAVLMVLDEGSVSDMARVADAARQADETTVRSLPAAEQLLVLTYRLRPELLEAEDPFAALVEARLAGQDRSLGEIGSVSPAGGDVALGVVLDPTTRSPTPLRWRFHQEGEGWRFDLVEAHRLLSQTIDNSARRAGVGVDDLVAATVVDLSGEPADTVEALYTEPPG